MFGSIGLPEFIVLLLIVAFGVFICGRIFSKAGYSYWLGITWLIPLVNVMVLVWFAFADWPALRRRDEDARD